MSTHTRCSAALGDARAIGAHAGHSPTTLAPWHHAAAIPASTGLTAPGKEPPRPGSLWLPSRRAPRSPRRAGVAAPADPGEGEADHP